MKLCVIDDSKPFLDVFINEIQVIGEELGLKMNIQAFDKYTPDIQSFDLYFRLYKFSVGRGISPK